MFNRNLAITNCFRKNEEAGPNQKQCSVVDVSGGEMAAHSSTLAWKIPCTEEPGGLQSMGALLDTCLVVTCQELDFPFTFHFHALEKEMATTPVFSPGESQGWGSLVGCHLCITQSQTQLK